MISARALHYVFKIGNRAKNAHFFREILGMKVLRHEEFTQGCDAACNGPYDNRWSKTMIGYGPESDHFVIELTYNYGVKEYTLGNDFGGITIQSTEVIERATKQNYPMVKEDEHFLLVSPDGYKFFVINENVGSGQGADPVQKVTLNCTDLERSIQYWHGELQMKQLVKNERSVQLAYQENGFVLELKRIQAPLDRAKAYGRIAFAVPLDLQPIIDETIKKSKNTILTPLISLDTPGKATVRVIILADPDGHEICFVDEEGFTELSQVDPASDGQLDKYIKKDPFQE
ncbi:glyoxalase domain-containing protein 4 isoform X1 [Topomyia yanbarensis]|uniref:glyoxalase domain-containing protein 4 isoform X1 n=2 Tax=Topomyia yanbarensis TaxID=2498891 RepID=UPI00273BD07D|nr:glyoxalase domain-containing protein 4 isoform X1 [Topomyia yanbarensis]